MSAGHTPGPWQVDDTAPNSYVRIVGNIDGDAYDDGSPRHIYTHVCDVLDNEQEEANARLIAAAPELLESLTWALRQLDHNSTAPGYAQKLAVAFKAIAKATGKESA